MLIFGHAGLTLGAAILLKSTLAKCHSLPPRANTGMERLESTSGMHSTQNYPSSGSAKWLVFLEKIDIRLLLVGSLLPDIIDKHREEKGRDSSYRRDGYTMTIRM